MGIKLEVPEYSIETEYAYTIDVFNEQKQFPVLSIGRDSYIEQAVVETILDSQLIYNIQVGRYSSIESDVTFVIDKKRDFISPCQGKIKGVDTKGPKCMKREGQIVIMNDCRIGEKATIFSGVTIGNGAIVTPQSVVTKDVPSYAIVSGNPAKIIGYRFEEKYVEALNVIRWWNWTEEKVISCAEELYGDISDFISVYLDEAKQEINGILPIDVKPIEKVNQGEEKIYLYIPDFEQDYPTYPKVIEGFIKSFADTNNELLLYIKEDDFLSEKLAILDELFTNYEDVNCYINLYIGSVDDERSLFTQVDAYITNRGLNNVKYMDIANLFGVPVISGVDVPIFSETKIYDVGRNGNAERYNGHSASDNNILSKESMKKLVDAVKSQNTSIENIHKNLDSVYKNMSQLSINQYAMNCSVNNLKYEILNSETPIYPIVVDGERAVELICNERKSICRFGDGEFSVMAGVNRQKFQKADEKLAKRLKEVLASKDENILVCIADMYGDLSKYNDDTRYNIRAYMSEKVREEHYSILDMSRTYYDANLSRPYASYRDNTTEEPRKRFDKLRKIWQDKKLLVIEGEKTRMGLGNDLFDNATDIIRILGPAEHAFDKYDELLAEALKQDKERLVLIAMGATATVLAYDLAKAGFQALDIGHIDIEYEWMLAGKGKKVEVKHKYNNEVEGGEYVEEIYDPTYENQIVARLY